ncbi:MAG: hypothetical protein R2836_00165 [Chitinophagales bacterium]
MINKIYLAIIFSLFIAVQYAQSPNSLVGDWKLKDAEIIDESKTKDIVKEESFFGYYLDQENTLRISDNSISIVVGGEQFNYTYQATNKYLILTYLNTIIIQTENKKTITKTTEGNTRFKFKLNGNVLTLNLKNGSLVEEYTFVKSN